MTSNVMGNDGGENVITATLIRGKTYTFNDYDEETKVSNGYHKFERAKAKPVSEELAAKLEELTEEVEDRDGDKITKDMFRIDRDIPLGGVTPLPKKKRFRLVSEEVEERPVARAPLRKPLVAAPKKAGFAGRRG